MNLKRETLAHYDRILALLRSDEAKTTLYAARDSLPITSFLYDRGEAPTAKNCPLCMFYHTKCQECPVARGHEERTGCNYTPWMRIPGATGLDEYIAAVEKEREFLAGLDYSTGIVRWVKKAIEKIRRSIRGQEKRN